METLETIAPPPQQKKMSVKKHQHQVCYYIYVFQLNYYTSVEVYLFIPLFVLRLSLTV